MEEKEIYLLITRHLADRATAEENGLLADWRTASEENEVLFEEIRSVWLAGIKPDQQAKQALTRLKERIRAEEKIKPIRRNRLIYLSAAASVAAILVLILARSFWQAPAIETPMLTVETGLKQKKSILLEDGTRIVLAPQSSLVYPAGFSGDLRTVQLQGEAYFEVSKNPHRPFIVHTADLDVKVLGTHFDVSSYPDQPASTVSLLEGRVAVSIAGENGAEYILKPSEQLVLNHLDRRVSRYGLDSSSTVGWMTNTLAFKNVRIADAAEKISKLYGVKVVLADQLTADTRLYGTFTNESLEQVMETLEATGNIQYRIENNKLHISMRK
ncbi:MAG: FecR domain-containing protein [Chitinophagaceae bacterium]